MPKQSFFVGHYDNGTSCLIQPQDFNKPKGKWEYMTFGYTNQSVIVFPNRAEAIKYHERCFQEIEATMARAKYQNA